MGVLVQPSDFTGKWAVPDQEILLEQIADCEETYLNTLLGGDLYAYFKTLLPVAGLTGAYLTIFNAFNQDWYFSLFKSKGMKVMLLNFIWFEVMRIIKFKATQDGVIVNSPGDGKSTDTGTLYKYYNEGVDTFNAIQKYIGMINPGPFSVATIGPSGNQTTFNGQALAYTIPHFGL